MTKYIFLILILSISSLFGNCNDYIFIESFHEISDSGYEHRILFSNNEISVNDTCMSSEIEEFLIDTELFVVNDSIFIHLLNFVNIRNTFEVRPGPFDMERYKLGKEEEAKYCITVFIKGKQLLKYYINGDEEALEFFDQLSSELKKFDIEYKYSEKYY